jgi:hypothetical protein
LADVPRPPNAPTRRASDRWHGCVDLPCSWDVLGADRQPVRRHDRLRFTSRGSSVLRTVAILAAGLLVMGWTVGQSILGSESTTNGARTKRSEDVTVRAPDGWKVQFPEPRFVLTARTGSSANYGSRCDTDEHVTVLVDRFSGSRAERPDNFGPDAGSGLTAGDEYPCGELQAVGFRENGESFRVLVFRGRRASASKLAAAYQLLDSMSFH